MRIALSGLALATAVRMVDRVHRKTAHGGPDSQPALRAGLAVAAQIVLVIAHLAEGGAAIDVHLACLTRLQPQIGVDALARRKGHRAARAARKLAALAGFHLH